MDEIGRPVSAVSASTCPCLKATSQRTFMLGSIYSVKAEHMIISGKAYTQDSDVGGSFGFSNNIDLTRMPPPRPYFSNVVSYKRFIKSTE